MNVSLNEIVALKLVLEYVSIKDLLTSAMHYYSSQADTKSQDNADLCYKAINSFLK